jgi:hypothetical protein
MEGETIGDFGLPQGARARGIEIDRYDLTHSASRRSR